MSMSGFRKELSLSLSPLHSFPVIKILLLINNPFFRCFLKKCLLSKLFSQNIIRKIKKSSVQKNEKGSLDKRVYWG